jgi:hypothetical protein
MLNSRAGADPGGIACARAQGGVVVFPLAFKFLAPISHRLVTTGGQRLDPISESDLRSPP